MTENYRWLEDGKSPDVKKWTAKQNEYTREFLGKLPDSESIRRRVTQILSADTIAYWDAQYRGDLLFTIKRQPPKQQPFLVVYQGSEERILVDPNSLDPDSTTTIDWYIPSPTGRWVAVSLSKSGTESGDVSFFETKSGRQVFEVIPRVNGGTAGGDLAWEPNEKGVYYTRYPRGQERAAEDLNFFQQLYYHRLGTQSSSDRYELGKQLPRIAEIKLESDASSGRLLVTVQNGDGGEFAHFLRTSGGEWKQFSEFSDQIVQAIFGHRDDIYLVSREEAPRGKILRMSIESLDPGNAQVVVEQGEDTVVTNFWSAPTVLPTRDRLFVVYQLGGPSEIRAFDLDGNPKPAPRQLDVGSVGGMSATPEGRLLFSNRSFVAPNRWCLFDPQSEKTADTPLVNTSPVTLDDVTVVREFATSKDGTKVPLNILLPPGAKSGTARPCLVTGYGGYGINIEPRFQSMRRVLLEQGMIYVVANLRGGGEYGKQWHRQGNLTNKQNVFDDFAAVLKHLIERGYTRSDLLAIEGGSNGGLLMGATLTQHHDLMKVVVSHVGIYDMLRVELSPNGAFNIPEFGTVKDRSQFEAMHAYSPYHHVVDRRKYPATLLLTGENDPRVDPMHSRKMIARLQAASAGDAPLLLRTASDAGHGSGTTLDEQISQVVDVYSFLFDQLGLRYQQP